MLSLVVAVAVASVASCDPCAGTPSCHGFPEVSYGGQFIERQSGRSVPGVRVLFVRDSGREMPSDTLSAVSDADGFFRIRSGVYGHGTVVGRLEVKPPPPHTEYVVPGFRLTSSTVRGDGVFAGRLVVNPYSMFIGEVIDRRTNKQVTGAKVTLVRLGGVATGPDSVSFVTGELGRFLFEPTIDGYGAYEYMVTVEAPGDPEVYRFPHRVIADYLDRDPYPLLIKFPRVLYHLVEVSRRGTGEFLQGVEATFVRTGGIRVVPETLSAPLENGRFGISPVPLEDGVLVGDLTISPPMPFPTEVIRNLELATHYDDSVRFVGIFGYGAQVALQALLRNRATDLPLKQGTQGIVRRVSGLPFVDPPGAQPSADSGIRNVDALGRLLFVAATADTGAVVFDVEVRLAGFPNEILRGLTARARYDSEPDVLGPFRVGAWFPWYGELRDADTDAAIAGATATFQRAQGIEMVPATVRAISDTNGRFHISAEPLSLGAAVGALSIRFPNGAYRDSVIAGVQITSTQDDTLRLLQVYRFKRLP